MGIGDILKGIGMVIGATVMHGIDRVNNHNEKVKELKAKFLRENTSVEKLGGHGRIPHRGGRHRL